MLKNLNTRYTAIAGLIFLAALTRLIPHPPNFAPIMGIAIFGGASFKDKRYAFIVPILAMLLSDLILGFHSSMLAVYLCFIIAVFLGISISNKINITKIAVAVFSGSILFFIITNLSVWLFSGMYPISLTGLTECYAMAIPFFGYSLLGDTVYSGVLFGGFALAARYVPALSTSEQ